MQADLAPGVPPADGVNHLPAPYTTVTSHRRTCGRWRTSRACRNRLRPTRWSPERRSVRRLRQSSSNMTEALGFFLHFFKQQPQFYAEFPQEFTEAVDAAVGPRPSEVARIVSSIGLLCVVWFAFGNASSSPALLVVLAACATTGWNVW
ncbi:unnamed protein product [Prorocentrum cordatum]|uniref:PRA1 family protein n=1 Tax=Prorocentrum cordatum TaxID=2364126 RepID=A0ABN9VPH7_9DINO|nr:unnamed protein product [Polarella glacialis]